MQNCAIAPTPYVYGKRSSKSQCPKKGQKPLNMPYAQAVGSLMYAMLCTRPDLAYSVILKSRYQSNPEPAH